MLARQGVGTRGDPERHHRVDRVDEMEFAGSVQLEADECLMDHVHRIVFVGGLIEGAIELAQCGPRGSFLVELTPGESGAFVGAVDLGLDRANRPALDRRREYDCHQCCGEQDHRAPLVGLGHERRGEGDGCDAAEHGEHEHAHREPDRPGVLQLHLVLSNVRLET